MNELVATKCHYYVNMTNPKHTTPDSKRKILEGLIGTNKVAFLYIFDVKLKFFYLEHSQLFTLTETHCDRLNNINVETCGCPVTRSMPCLWIEIKICQFHAKCTTSDQRNCRDKEEVVPNSHVAPENPSCCYVGGSDGTSCAQRYQSDQKESCRNGCGWNRSLQFVPLEMEESFERRWD